MGERLEAFPRLRERVRGNPPRTQHEAFHDFRGLHHWRSLVLAPAIVTCHHQSTRLVNPVIGSSGQFTAKTRLKLIIIAGSDPSENAIRTISPGFG